MNIQKIKDLANNIGKYCVSSYCRFFETLAEKAEMARLYNEVYSLSSHVCAECVSQSAKQLAAARTAPGHITYIGVMNEAIEMLANGYSQSDVVFHFDMMVAKEYRKI